MAKGKSAASSIAMLIGLFLLVAHAMTIAGDVQAVVEDPNVENKPGEILKLALDLSRYTANKKEDGRTRPHTISCRLCQIT
jgi:hypothetical protein